MTVYEQLIFDSQIIRMFEPELDAKIIRFDRNGNLKALQRLTHDMPWLQNKTKLRELTGNACNRFQMVAKRLGFIHSVCLDCYKVVIGMNKVTDLFKFYEWQQGIDIAGKCGIETREFVPRLYGGYFYNRGLKDGKDCWKLVSEEVHKKISPDIKVILKRGCTEFELKYGDSTKWTELPDQKQWEEKLNSKLVEDCKLPEEEPEDLIAYIKASWIHFAANAKPPDMSYLELTGGEMLHKHVPYRTYHDEKPLIKVV